MFCVRYDIFFFFFRFCCNAIQMLYAHSLILISQSVISRCVSSSPFHGVPQNAKKNEKKKEKKNAILVLPSLYTISYRLPAMHRFLGLSVTRLVPLSPFLVYFYCSGEREEPKGGGGKLRHKKRGRANPTENLREPPESRTRPGPKGKKGSVTCGWQPAVAMTTG
ncbi:AIS_HP2_G0016040.mRNA.1.CDS.1 [Saccharomyces cerevisiae]|nr:AIS_HP2_G0016040.mRNA.1.CDS.1 [Saccharomyces cerevisiae]CAI6487019.1 AIS_HP2_G0016040.mRNA.1.CDS.1 [Saccharomyces cerevisiae]